MKPGRNTAGYAGIVANLFGATRLGGALQGVQKIKDKERDYRLDKQLGRRRKKRRQELNIQSQSHYG
jgi:hypothetical protein